MLDFLMELFRHRYVQNVWMWLGFLLVFFDDSDSRRGWVAGIFVILLGLFGQALAERRFKRLTKAEPKGEVP